MASRIKNCPKYGVSLFALLSEIICIKWKGLVVKNINKKLIKIYLFKPEKLHFLL